MTSLTDCKVDHGELVALEYASLLAAGTSVALLVHCVSLQCCFFLNPEGMCFILDSRLCLCNQIVVKCVYIYTATMLHIIQECRRFKKGEYYGRVHDNMFRESALCLDLSKLFGKLDAPWMCRTCTGSVVHLFRYHIATGMPGDIIVQRPGEDAAGAGIVITVAQAIHVPVRRQVT